MKYDEYRRKKWRERIKFDRRNQVDIEEIVWEMRAISVKERTETRYEI